MGEDDFREMARIAAESIDRATTAMASDEPMAPSDADRSLARLVVMSIRASDYGAPPFVQLPVHLPSTAGGLYALLMSKGREDYELRRDLNEWVSINRLVEARSAMNLKVCIEVAKSLEEALRHDDDDELQGYLDTITKHIEHTWHTRPERATGNVEHFATGVASEDNPVPGWMYDGTKPEGH